MQIRILLGPAPSLHGLRSGRGRLVRSLPRYFGQVRLLHRTHRRLRPPAFPTTSRPRLTGTAMEISRFPSKRLLRMPGSTTTRGQHASCDIDTGCVAFCWTENISAPNLSYAAQYLACALPCERFTSALADIRASLGAGAVRYSFTVTDFHRLPLAGLPAHPSRHGRYSRTAANSGDGFESSPGCSGESKPRSAQGDLCRSRAMLGRPVSCPILPSIRLKVSGGSRGSRREHL